MRQKKQISLKWGVMIIILTCWVLPILMIVATSGVLLSRSYEKNLRSGMQVSVDHAMEQTVLRWSAALESSKAVSYGGEIRSAYRDYVRTEDRQALYKAVSSYFSQNFARDENFKAVFLTFYDHPESLYYYMASYRTTSYRLVRDYRESVRPAVLESLSEVDTGIYFLQQDGEVYMARNLLDTQFQPYAALVMQCDMDTLCRAFTAITNVSRADITLDTIDWPLLDTQPDPLPGEREISVSRTAEFAGHTLTVEVAATRHDLWSSMPGLRTAVALLLLLGIPLLLLVIWLFYHFITVPMAQMTDAAARVQSGERGYQIAARANSTEFQKIFDQFNRMSMELQRQFERLYREQQALQQARIKALQSQINPHFLNNTLEIINWEARLAENEQVCKMVDALSTMLDGALGRDGQGMIPLREELGYLDAYLYIIRERLGERLLVEKELDETLLPVLIPRLILQPIVENAVEHDIVPHRGGRLTLRALRQDGKLLLEAEHDGTIRAEDAEKLDQLLHSDVTPASHRSMGLRNVRDRLRLLYGDEAAISIFQSAPGVILAQISLPL